MIELDWPDDGIKLAAITSLYNITSSYSVSVAEIVEENGIPLLASRLVHEGTPGLKVMTIKLLMLLATFSSDNKQTIGYFAINHLHKLKHTGTSAVQMAAATLLSELATFPPHALTITQLERDTRI